MSNLRLKSIAVIAGATVLLAVSALVLTFTGAGQAIAEQIEGLFGASTVYDYMYGVVGGEYAVHEKKISFSSSSGTSDDTLQDIVTKDGTVKFHASTADTKHSQDTVWSDYRLTPDCINAIQENRLIIVYNKAKGLYGGINRDGSKKIDYKYSQQIGDNGTFCYGISKSGTKYVVDIYDSKTYKLVKSLSYTVTGDLAYVNLQYIGQSYFCIRTGSSGSSYNTYYFSFNSGVVTELTGISVMSDNNYGSVAYVKSDNSLWLNNPGESAKQIAKLTGSNYTSMTVGASVIELYVNGQGYEHYTFKGNQIQGTNYYGNVVKGNFNNYAGLSDSYTNKTNFYDQDGNFVKSIDGVSQEGYKSTCSDYLVTQTSEYTSNGYKLTVKGFDRNLNYVKDLFSCESEYTISMIPTTIETKVFKGLRLSSYTTGIDKIYDINFNECENYPDFQLADGTLIYIKDRDGYDVKPTFVDKNGNYITINGYTLDTYWAGTGSYNRGGALNLQHGDDDIWFAKNSAGKYGAIDSYGNVVVPFDYTKECDLGHNDTNYFMGYKNGKWEFVNVNDKPIPHPQPEVGEVTSNSVELSWKAIPSATKYAIASKKSDGSYHTYTLDCKNTTYKVTGLKEDTTYRFVVQAYVSSRWSDFDEEDLVRVKTNGTKPNPEVVETGDGTITLSWPKVDGATKYAVAECENGKYINFTTELKDTKYTIKDIANGYYHLILVQAYVDGKWSSFTKDDMLKVKPSGSTVRPVIQTTDATYSSIKVTWGAVPGAKRYAVNWKTYSSSWKSTTVSKDKLNATISGLEDGTIYQVLIQADIYGWTSFGGGDIVSQTTKSYRPNVQIVTTGDGSATLKWEPIEGATKYAIAERENGKYINYEVEYKGTEITLDNLANNYGHLILVQAWVNGKWSKFDDSNLRLVTPVGPTVKPAITKIEGASKSINLTWCKVPGAKRYAINYRKSGTKSWSCIVVNPDKLDYTIKNLTSGTTYECLVQADIYGTWSKWDQSKDVKITTVK